MTRSGGNGRGSHLVLVTHRRASSRPDFERIAARVSEEAPDVTPFVIEDARSWAQLPRLALKPTLVFCPHRIKHFRPLRGRICQGRPLGKAGECRALERLGLPVPRWTTIGPDRTPDLSGFEDYVVVKPDHGGRGAQVKIKRRGRVRWRPPDVHHGGRSEQWFIQDFVYTGRWPVSYRVSTLFGTPLYALRFEADRSRRPLLGPEGFTSAGGGGVSIVSSGRGCTVSVADDPEILELAERSHAAFPEIPLLGVDIVREHGSGKLWVLEVNSIGQTWHFSSRYGRRFRDEFGIDLDSQFDGLHLAARVLARQARANAR